MESADEEVVLTTVRPGCTLLELQRPHRRNALSHEVIERLEAGIADAEHRGDAAVVLTGGDAYFSSGGDVGTMPTTSDGVFGPAARLSRIHDLIHQITRSDLIVIAAVEGYAIGAAWGLVLSCDLVVAADDAYFSAPFAARGLAADAGTAFHLPRLLGHHRAAQHLLLGDPLPASTAHELGLVSQLVGSGTATEHACQAAQRLASGPRESNAVTKSLITRTYASDLADFLAAERVAVSLAGHGRDATEGRAAFTERREPRFT
ncbi:enoyl-CoA hydratase/isomerase family protein [Aeromicrobium sp. CF3.5]|uniref:enoyl-CoA hydratase/isomerase family protein n=1 Tax=Aeromicrobium sp. CF3.5 TaxID=3373078 RepID=UPI003EE627E5